MPGSSVRDWTPRSPSWTRKTLGSAASRPASAVTTPRNPAGDGHRVVQFDRLGVGVVRVPPRLQDLAEDALLPRVGEDLARGEVVAVEGDPDADLVVGDDELVADLPGPVERVVEVASLGQDAVVVAVGLHALVIAPVLGRGGELHVGLQVEPGPPDQDRLAGGPDLDLADVVQDDHGPQGHGRQPEQRHEHRRPSSVRIARGVASR